MSLKMKKTLFIYLILTFMLMPFTSCGKVMESLWFNKIDKDENLVSLGAKSCESFWNKCCWAGVLLLLNSSIYFVKTHCFSRREEIKIEEVGEQHYINEQLSEEQKIFWLIILWN